MSGEVGAAGDLITGALWARAVEPAAGEESEGRAPALCLNCGTRLIGAHCHACGQAAHVHKSIGAIGHEIAHGVFHVEGKIWRTMPMLALHPGQLTRRYIDGERVRFVSPLALFLFTVFLLFATISWVGPSDLGRGVSADMAGAENKVAESRTKTREALAGLERWRAAAVASGQPIADLDKRIAKAREDIRALDAVQAHFRLESGETVTVNTKWSWLKHALVDKIRENPSLALYKLQSSAYKYSWVLIPLSTPFVALLFLWRRRFGLYDHAIFVTYSLAFMMLLVTVLTLAGAAGAPGGWIALAAVLVPPIHMYKQLRGAYELRRFSAAWRMMALTWFAFAVLIAFTLLLLLHGLAD